MNTNTSQPASRGVRTNRREFLSRSALAAATFTIVPCHVLGGAGQPSANEKLNIAGVGVGGMGQSNLAKCATENIVALCDVDAAYAAKTFAQYPQAKTYRDFRVMLDQQKDIDAVIVATPDHTHAVVALAAMQLGKHVYVQKPMAHSVHEARHGAIGAVREVHAWTNRPVWPQGIEVDRPQDAPAVPASLDWDLWIGPAAVRPFHPTYHPGLWRAWWDFGTGSLGDLGCHILDAPFWALNLTYPVSVEGCISTYWHALWQETKPKNETYPRSTIVRFTFPARDTLPEVKLTWWDGGMLPPRPDELEEGRQMGDSDGGVLFIGDQGTLMCGCYGRDPQLIPAAKMQAYAQPSPTLERIPGGLDGHEQDWVRACKGGAPASSNFDYSGPLSEMVLMGNLAVRHPNRKLLWNGEKMEVTNDAEANAYVRRQYRQGWTL
jgi:predicted dehydrogenase